MLDTSTYKLHEYLGHDIPPYGILSHRWENEEVTFQDLRHGLGPERQGWRKIVGCCKHAIGDRIDYVVSTMFLNSMYGLASQCANTRSQSGHAWRVLYNGLHNG